MLNFYYRLHQNLDLELYGVWILEGRDNDRVNEKEEFKVEREGDVGSVSGTQWIERIMISKMFKRTRAEL